jgi:hypothetical protein
MSIGSGIALVVIGAILSFALRIQTGWVNLQLIGYILMAAGVVVFVIGLVYMLRRRQSTTTVQSGLDGSGRRVTQQHTSTTPDDAP